jgi:short-subunit dehydrogenase
VLVGRHAARLETLVADLKARGAASAETLVADLNDLANHGALIARAQTALGTIDRALIAHGTLGDQRAGEADAQAALGEITTNFLSAASILTHLGNIMEGQKSGAIAVIGSVAGDRGRQSNYIYGSAKAGLAAFVQGLRHRLARHGVAVCLIKPGFVDTPMTAAFPKGPLWASPERVAADIHAALERGTGVVYTPWFWQWIMLIIRTVPDRIFLRTRL